MLQDNLQQLWMLLDDIIKHDINIDPNEDAIDKIMTLEDELDELRRSLKEKRIEAWERLEDMKEVEVEDYDYKDEIEATL
jgi:hypothetical protein